MDGRPEPAPGSPDGPASDRTARADAQDRERALRELADAIGEALREVEARGCAAPEDVAAMLREVEEEWAEMDRAQDAPRRGGRA